MKTEHELNADILKISMKIRETYPELTKYITEMPITVPNDVSPEINIKSLSEYYDSLLELMRKYGQNHAKTP
jgi:hypothetical protein